MASPYKNMPTCARMWFQAARGRAIVQKNLMRKARAEARRVAIQEAAYRPANSLVSWYVSMARRACKDWRQYRRNYLECKKDGI